MASINRPETCECGHVALDQGRPGWPVSLKLALIILSLPAWWFLYISLEPFSHWLTYTVMGLGPQTHLGEAVAFFLLDVPKIFLLLVIVIFAIGMVRSFFSPERTRAILAGHREIIGDVLAALLGVVTPFCSCSAVPLFIGFIESGVPLGVTFAFLVSAPMVNEIALVLLWGLFGWEIALLYMGTGLAIAMASGVVIGRLSLESWVEDWVYQIRMAKSQETSTHLSWNGRIEYGLQAVKDIIGRVWVYIIIGIAVGAGIHGYVPANAMAAIMGSQAWWSVPLAVLVGVPVYSNAAGIIPIVQALLGKGAALGTVLAFMMSVIAISFPEMVILRKVLKIKLIAVFIAVVACGIILVGFLFNMVL
jgi:uncharacterized membrane protein YraQ (UPF0718 family)